jgi:two-component system sensor histidine kinase DegS
MNAPGSAGVNAADGRFDDLRAEAESVVGRGAEGVRAIRDRFREAYVAEIEHWQELRHDLEAAERPEARVDETRLATLRAAVDEAATRRATHQATLSRLELAVRALEAMHALIDGDDGPLDVGPAELAAAANVQARVIEAQEAERARLAQEIHDGPAQALSNAIFQVEFVDRMLDRDPEVARAELRYLREVLRRELGDVRGFISQLRPPLLDELGLDGALRDAAEQTSASSAVVVTTFLAAPAAQLAGSMQPVVLRVAQEALHNVRKHSGASSATVATRVEGDDWVLEVSDDGRGFDVETVARRGQRNFGLQFMRERAALIGATFEVRSRPEGGTVVRLAVPMGAERSR